MGTKDKRVDAYVAKSADFAKPILNYLRKVVHDGCPEVQETMKWSFPHFDHMGIMCSMAAFKEHCAFNFWKASLMKDPHKVLQVDERASMGHFGRITRIADLPSKAVLAALVKEAAALNEEGTKRAKTVKPKKALNVPSYFMAALKKNNRALTTFNAFTPSAKREYVEWVTEAKTEETRARRLTTAIEWMADGKQRNWRYMEKR